MNQEIYNHPTEQEMSPVIESATRFYPLIPSRENKTLKTILTLQPLAVKERFEDVGYSGTLIRICYFGYSSLNDYIILVVKRMIPDFISMTYRTKLEIEMAVRLRDSSLHFNGNDYQLDETVIKKWTTAVSSELPLIPDLIAIVIQYVI